MIISETRGKGFTICSMFLYVFQLLLCGIFLPHNWHSWEIYVVLFLVWFLTIGQLYPLCPHPTPTSWLHASNATEELVKLHIPYMCILSLDIGWGLVIDAARKVSYVAPRRATPLNPHPTPESYSPDLQLPHLQTDDWHTLHPGGKNITTNGHSQYMCWTSLQYHSIFPQTEVACYTFNITTEYCLSCI